MNLFINKGINNAYSSYLFLIFFMLISTVFIESPELGPGVVLGQQIWFHWTTVVFSLSIFIGWFFLKDRVGYSFCFQDLIVVVLILWNIVTYNQNLLPAYSRYVFSFQLLPFWFFLRFSIMNRPDLKFIFIIALVLTGIIEAIWGLLQLYNITNSNHFLFRLTGSFYNPGPYSGYLSVILPIALDFAFKYKSFSVLGKLNNKNLLYVFFLLTIIFIMTVLPSGMSRSAWLASIVSCSWIMWVRLSGSSRLKMTLNKYRNFRELVVTMLVLVFVSGFIGAYLIKKDSADGRFLLWKISARVIAKEPINGTGFGGFAFPYAQEQEKYFASGEASNEEKEVAGTPEYLFNEYLQLIIEQGIFGFLFFSLLIGSCFYTGIKTGQTAACGGLIALCVFAFSSYPLQLPSFCIVLTILLVLCLEYSDCKLKSVSLNVKCWALSISSSVILLIVMISVSLTVCFAQNKIYNNYRAWNKIRKWYQHKAYDQATSAYDKLYPGLKYDPVFLFEYAQCLSNNKQYLFSNMLLKKASILKVDPMFYNIIAKNYHALGNYKEAEHWLWRSINLVPERIYPYYLLTKLYTHPDCNDLEKAKEIAILVLGKSKWIDNQATRKMREEISRLIIEEK